VTAHTHVEVKQTPTVKGCECETYFSRLAKLVQTSLAYSQISWKYAGEWKLGL